MKILALDPATLCGWAHSDGPSGTWDLSILRDESAGMRLIRLRSKLNEILEVSGVDLLVYEAARFAGGQGALVVQSEIQSVIKVWCYDKSIEYRGYSSSEIKLFATGKGNAPKAKMLESAQKKWPGRAFKDDNEVDAVWLLELAKSKYHSKCQECEGTGKGTGKNGICIACNGKGKE